MKKVLLTFFISLVPFQAFAADVLTRRETFVQIWEGITRQVEPLKKAGYIDVPKGDADEPLLSYAKSRKLTTDAEAFRPSVPALRSDALIWLLKTRNITDPDEVTLDTVSNLALANGLAGWVTSPEVLSLPITSRELEQMIKNFDAHLAAEVHEVSLYGEEFQGQGTAFGETFDLNDFTAAHRTLPHHTLVRVTNVANGKSVLVRINDRGPFVKGRDMDLSVAAFTALAPRSQGKFLARFERLGDARIVGPCRADVPYQRRISRGVYLDPGMPRYLHLGQVLHLRANGSMAILQIRYPDGSHEDLQKWVLLGNEFSLQPSQVGEYSFLIRDRLGTRRWFTTQVVACT
jgi:rare lipoprotein A